MSVHRHLENKTTRAAEELTERLLQAWPERAPSPRLAASGKFKNLKNAQ
jgi:hypothetical protein